MYVTRILLLVANFLKTAWFWQRDAKKVRLFLSGHTVALSPPPVKLGLMEEH